MSFEKSDVFHERVSRELFDQAYVLARERYPAAAETLVRRTALELLKSATSLAYARNGYFGTGK